MNKPKISIITPSYNQGQYIEQTIDSVLSQNYPNLEYIIIDGGSSDNSVEIIKKYEKHLKYWISEPDRGQSHAINKGFKHCTGDLINWLNSDDYYEPGIFNELAQLSLDHPQKNVFAFRERQFGQNGESMIHEGTPVFDNLGEAIFYSEIDQPATFFRKQVWDKLFPLNEDLHYIMDGELWVRYLLVYNFSHMYQSNMVAVNFRLHDSSKTTNNKQNRGFLKERTGVVLAVLKACDAPDMLLNKVHEYYFEDSEFNNIDRTLEIQKAQRRKILRYFANKTSITALRKGDKKLARAISIYSLGNAMNFMASLNIIRKTI